MEFGIKFKIMNSATIGALMIVGVVVLYIFALWYVEGKIARQQNEKLEKNIDNLDDKA